MKKLTTLVIAAMMVMTMAACGGSSYESATSDKGFSEPAYTEKAMEMAVEEKPAAMEDFAGSVMKSKEDTSEEMQSEGDGSQTDALAGRYIIKNGYIYMETLEYDKTIKAVNQMIAKFNGYTSFSESNNGDLYEGEYYHRSSRFTIKVPAVHFESMYNEMNTVGNVVNANEGKQDVTLQYIDLDSRIKTLEIQEERLLAILEKSEKLEDIIELEQSLQEVRYEIERNTTELRHLQDLVSYSTIELQVQEVYERREVEKPAITLGDRISSGLNRTFNDLIDTGENLIVFVITQFPYLIVLGLVIFFMVRAAKKRFGAGVEVIKKAEKEDDHHDSDPS